jgi:hypothetical protein
MFSKAAEALRQGTETDPLGLNSLVLIRDFFRPLNQNDELDDNLGSQIGITSFEMFNSGLVNALLDWLMLDSSNALDNSPCSKTELLRRIAFFAQKFLLEPQEPTALRLLIKRLQECVSRLEPFDLNVPLTTSFTENGRFSSTNNALWFLGRQLRVRLQPAEDIVQALKSFEDPNSSSSVDIGMMSDSSMEDGMVRVASATGTGLVNLVFLHNKIFVLIFR